MASESEEYAKTLEWRHSMGKAGIERLLEHFKVNLRYEAMVPYS